MTKPSLTMTRLIKSSPDKVFKAWSDPALMARWMGPRGTTMVEAKLDLRVGGRYGILMVAGGEEHFVSGTYREIVPGEKLVFTWAWRSTPERESLVTVLVRPAEGGTELTLKHEQFFDDMARDMHRQGWEGALDKLVELFATEE